LPGSTGRGNPLAGGKKTAEAIRQEVTREVEQLVGALFTGRRKTGHLDLEAVEMLVRSAMHQAGATVLTELLRFPEPDQRTIACPCGQQARYRELRAKTVALSRRLARSLFDDGTGVMGIVSSVSDNGTNVWVSLNTGTDIRGGIHTFEVGEHVNIYATNGSTLRDGDGNDTPGVAHGGVDNARTVTLQR